VACLIDDIDVIGGSGGNIGYVIKKDEEGQEYA
jgi:predicted acetyltransferase